MIIDKFDVFDVVDPENICPRTLKGLTESISELLTVIINSLWKPEYFVSQLSVSQDILLKKISFLYEGSKYFILPSEGNITEEDDSYVQTTEKCPSF